MINFVRTYETTNRKLENFLFIHDIFHLSYYKSPIDGLTVWVYADTPELRRVVAEYMEIAKRRAERRN